MKFNIYNGEVVWCTAEVLDESTDYLFVRPVLYVKAQDISDMLSRSLHNFSRELSLQRLPYWPPPGALK